MEAATFANVYHAAAPRRSGPGQRRSNTSADDDRSGVAFLYSSLAAFIAATSSSLYRRPAVDHIDAIDDAIVVLGVSVDAVIKSRPRGPIMCATLLGTLEIRTIALGVDA